MSASIPFIVTVTVAALLIGFGKGGLGGVVLAVVPLLSTVMDTRTALSVSLPLLLVGDVFGLYSFWREWDPRIIRLMLPAGIAGTIAGTYIVVGLDETLLRRIIGGLTLVYVAYRAADGLLQTLPYDPPPPVGRLAAFVAGVTSSLAAAGSPAFTAYYLLKHPAPRAFMGTFNAFFAVSNIVKLPFFIGTGLLTWRGFTGVAWAVPLIPLGVWLGRLFIRRVDRATFDRLLLGLLVLTGFYLLLIPAR